MKKATVIKAKPIRKDAMLAVLRKRVFQQATSVQQDYEKTTVSWERNKPKFVIRFKESFLSYEFFVGTDDQVYYRLDITGAKEHEIKPRNAKALTVPSKFTPRTRIGFLGSMTGGRSGVIYLRKKVNHPGFKARNFSKIIASRLEKRFLIEMQRAMKEAAQVSGHAL